jgi:nitrite reductase/ring-hydroxylating ferredoxin subunit
VRRIDLVGVDEVPDGTMKMAYVDGTDQVLVIHTGGRFQAVQGICSHEYFELDKGFLTAGTITCALHLSRFDLDSGEPLDTYTPGSPWTLPEEERRTPRFVTFSMDSYRLRSERLPLDPRPGTVAIFSLTPNDFGVADFDGVEGELQPGKVILRRPEGSIEFRRVEPRSEDADPE